MGKDDWKKSRVREEGGKIYYGDSELTEDELQGTLSRIEEMKRKNKKSLEKAPSILKSMMGEYSKLADEGQDATYNEGKKILERRKIKNK